MIVTWNVRGINKEARHREIGSCLSKFNVPVVALFERRVKNKNADNIRKKFGSGWNFADNYMHHDNGRMWILWKYDTVHIKMLENDEQYIHTEVCELDQSTQYAATILHAFNQLEKRKLLWKKIQS
ncbi:unnamed protein product [Lathyrus sativus]|nr:unnamed protein product [Lathyrus sativus]